MITGKVIGNYRVTGILGEGGMGVVYKAFDLKLERYVALKILNPGAVNNLQFVERFKREAKHQAGLNHPNIVPVYGFVEEKGTLGIVMEYVEGETLESYIMRYGQLPLKEALSIMMQILEGAGFAHKKGYVHRDFKPSNIIINNEGVVKIMDFGISKSLTETKSITKTGVKIGTILYMSPEQIKAQEPTNQSDIYSLGITFYEMLTGKTPFDYDTEYEIMEAHLKKEPPKISVHNPVIPPEVDDIIGKALGKSLQNRYKTCEELLPGIDSLIKKINMEKKKKKEREAKLKIRTAETPALQEGRASRRSRLSFYLFAFLLIIIAGFIAVVSYSAIRGLFEGAGK